MKLFLYEYIVSYRKEGKMQKEIFPFDSMVDNATFFNMWGNEALNDAQARARELRKEGYNACVDHKKVGEKSL